MSSGLGGWGSRSSRTTPRAAPIPAFRSRGGRGPRIAARGLSAILFGEHAIDLSRVEQIVDAAQARAIGDAILYARERYLDGRATLAEALARVERDLAEKGMDVLSPHRRGDYAMPRMLEVAAALNRLRTLECA